MDGLARLRTGMNFVALRRASHGLDARVVVALDRVLEAVARHFHGLDVAPSPALLERIDAALAAVNGDLADTGRREVLLGLADLRHSLLVVPVCADSQTEDLLLVEAA